MGVEVRCDLVRLKSGSKRDAEKFCKLGIGLMLKTTRAILPNIRPTVDVGGRPPGKILVGL